jgi:hypothetical protein
MPTKKSKNLPQPPNLAQTIGPSFILLGLALGSGELIFWPYLSANYGLGLLWGALLGISFQFVLNTEAMRYSLAWGESIFVGWRKLSILIPVWFIISTFIPWSLPGFSTASSEILSSLLPGLPTTVVAIALLIFTGLLLSLGRTLYQTMETFEKMIVFVSIPFVLILVLMFTSPVDWWQAAEGLIGKGDGWWFFPPGIALGSFLGAFAYAGAGGNLNLAQSHYIKEKGFGMGKYAAKIKSLFTSEEAQAVDMDGQLFSKTKQNEKLWQRWWHLVTLEHGIVFWFTGFVSIAMLAVLAKALVFGTPASQGLDFLYVEAAAISQKVIWLGPVFLVATAIMLFSTQVIVLEASSRIISENLLLLFYKKGKKLNLSLAFYAALWGQITLGIFLLLSGLKEPRFVLTLAAVLNAGAMMVAFPLLLWLNHARLRPAQWPVWWRKIVMVAAFLFFLYFVYLNMLEFNI